MKLDLGCGTTPLEGYVGVDLPLDEMAVPLETGPLQTHIDAQGIVRFDLASGIPWPFADGSIEALYSSHVIEHLPAGRIAVHEWKKGTLSPYLLQCTGTQDALFWFLDQAWRITQPGGELLLRWPALEDERTGALLHTAFIDPTHSRFIPLLQTLYWHRNGRRSLGVEQYRVACNWKPSQVCQRELDGGSIKIVENEILFVKEP